MDYHDLKMSELEQTAEESPKSALAAWDRGDLPAEKEVQKWTITLDNIRRRKGSVVRMSTRHSALESEIDRNLMGIAKNSGAA